MYFALLVNKRLDIFQRLGEERENNAKSHSSTKHVCAEDFLIEAFFR